MARFVSEALNIGQDSLVSSATQAHKLGTRAVSDDGRVFRYVKAGATLVAGNVIQSSAIVANHLANTPPAVAIGARSFTYTPGATAGAANLYSDGFLQVSVTPGLGYTYGVEGHAAISSSTAFTLYLKDPIQVALTTSSRVGLIANPYKNVIQMPVTTATGTVVGVAPYIITSGEFGWIQTWGLCSTLIAGTPALGAMVMAPGAVAGAAQVVVAAGTLIVAQIVGHMAQLAVDTEANYVQLRINP
jgi:hypothetical protein